MIGIICIGGDYIEHGDGIIRAQQGELLHLIVRKEYPAVAESLSTIYGVPVALADNPARAYRCWALRVGPGASGVWRITRIY